MQHLLFSVPLLSLVLVCMEHGAAWGQVPPATPTTVWLNSSLVNESSGLARSRRDDQLLWTHNDSGDKPRLFAFDTQGRLHAEVEIKKAKAIDWEDMCSFQLDGNAWLAVADVGDNLQLRSHVTIYGIKEPQVPRSNAIDGRAKAQQLSTKTDFEIKVKYPSGSLNCEALAYDPWRKHFLLLSKEQLRCQVFAVPFDADKPEQERTAELLFTLPVLLATGACISDDGNLLAIGSYGPTYILRRSTDGAQSRSRWAYTQEDDLQLIPAPLRKQGEALCFNASGTHLLMTSEGQPMPLITSPLPLALQPALLPANIKQ